MCWNFTLYRQKGYIFGSQCSQRWREQKMQYMQLWRHEKQNCGNNSKLFITQYLDLCLFIMNLAFERIFGHLIHRQLAVATDSFTPLCSSFINILYIFL